MEKYYIFGNDVKAIANRAMNCDVVKKLWSSFCLGDGALDIEECDGFVFRIGSTPLPELEDECEYAIAVDGDGVAVVGHDYSTLVRGFMVLIMKIEYGDDCFKIKHTVEKSSYTVKNRMIHICVFPQNDLYFIKKLVRVAALCQYTHIVIEFWGMLKYDCLKELSWPHAFTKAQAREIIDEARALGVEPIPMFNQLGHATACRVIYGKHVVLDQNPRLQHLFTPDGWAWNIHSQKVTEMFAKVRAELYELFGDGEYMHIGCDEAYYYTNHDDERRELPQFLSKLTAEVVSEGRRPMVWMDMMIEKGKHPETTASCRPEDVEPFINSLHPSTVLVDWQYHYKQKDVPSLVELGKRDYDVVGAPWLETENYEALVDTVCDHRLFGAMLTTWHTLKMQMPGILGCAKKMGAATFPWSEYVRSQLRSEMATMLRRISFEGNDYYSSGWSKTEIEL